MGKILVLRPDWANSLQDPIFKIITRGVAPAVQNLFCKHETPSSNPSPKKELKLLVKLLAQVSLMPPKH
jgi:hypothetical protein